MAKSNTPSTPRLTALVQGDDIKSELRKRNTSYVFHTIRSTTQARLKKKASLEEADGWEVAKKNKKSYRMQKRKPLHDQFEDDVWCIMALMGFSELSLGGNFRISVGKNTSPRQIDVFAKDKETSLVIECTQTDTPRVRDLSELIDKINALRDPILKSIQSHYGRTPKVKTKFVIATRNIIWRQADVDKCKNAGIAILRDEEIDYYKQLVKHLKHAARYQLLAHMFSGTGVEALAKQVPATQGFMGGKKFYNFLIRPTDLLKIAYVGHRSSRNVNDLKTYQRMLQPQRLRQIGEYIDKGGKFPTNIVVNIKARKNLRFERGGEQVGDESFGILHLPQIYSSAWIIDGQHRLYGYAYSSRGKEGKEDKSTVPVLAFENLSVEDEMNMFIDINSKQVKVRKSLIYELYSDLHWDSEDPPSKYMALLARVSAQLNSSRLSPIHDRVAVIGKKKSKWRCLTPTSLSDGLKTSKLLGSIVQGKQEYGPLSDAGSDDLKSSLNKAVSVLSRCLSLFSSGVEDNWKLGDSKGGYLCTNIAIRAIFILLNDICDHIEKKGGPVFKYLTDEDVFKAVKPYFDPLIDHFREAKPEQFTKLRQIGSSLASVVQQSRELAIIVKGSHPDFNPIGLQEYINTQLKEGTKQAAEKINTIQSNMHAYVITNLKQKYGQNNDDWWTKGIPKNIRVNCSEMWEEENHTHEIEHYLYMINYQGIALSNWASMGPAFALDEKDKGNKNLCVKWVKKLADIRNITHHPEKGELDAGQLDFVDDINRKVEHYFQLET